MPDVGVNSILSCLNEDLWNSERRGEGTSKLEQRLDEENSAYEQGDWLAATQDGGVKVMKGDPCAAAIAPSAPGETDIDQLRKLRIAQMKEQSAKKQMWLDKGHGGYYQLESEAAFLQRLPNHEKLVCALVTDSLDCRLVHQHLLALAKVHLETFFCSLRAETAPMMQEMVKLDQLPTLLLCSAGKVIHQLPGIDRSFTAEGVAYELSQHGLVDFEEGVNYSWSAGGCTTATIERAHRQAPLYHDNDSDFSDEVNEE